MNDIELYEFDRVGYIHIPGLLSADEAGALLDATKRLEEDALACADASPRFRAVWGPEYWRSDRHGYYAHGERADGHTLMVEEFWNFPSFDSLVGHPRTLAYVRRIVQGEIGINNSELRIRYPGNFTGMHLGFPEGHGPKYRYHVLEGRINCMMVRMIYFLHDVGPDEGVTCFVPATHKGNFAAPRGMDVEKEPGVVGIPVKAGDGILFTEAVRHGGFPNRSRKTRYTLHVGYGPHFLKSQNISTMEEEPSVSPALLERLTPEQRALLVAKRRQRL